MASRDLIHNLATVQLLAPIDKAHTNWKSTLLDTAGFESAVLIFHAGAFTGNDASNLLTVTMEESDTTPDANFTQVTTADLQAPGVDNSGSAQDPVVAAAGASSDYALGYIGSKRYIRLKGTYTLTGISAGIVGVTGLLSHAQYQPVAAGLPLAVTAT